MKALNHQAVLDYSAQDYESAQLGLREAIAMGQRAGMGSDPLMARLLANLGAVYISGLKDEKRGSRALESALALEPDIKLTDALATPELREVFSRLQSRRAERPSREGARRPIPSPTQEIRRRIPRSHGSPSPPPSDRGRPGRRPHSPPRSSLHRLPNRANPTPARPPATVAIVPAPPPPRRREVAEEPDLPARVPQPLYCPTPDEAPPSERITLHCVLQPEVNASKVLLYYRPPGARRFTSDINGPVLQGVVPRRHPGRGGSRSLAPFLFRGPRHRRRGRGQRRA